MKPRSTPFLVVLTAIALACNVPGVFVQPDSARPEPVRPPATTGPVKRSSSAIALTADGTTLLAVNPDSNSLTLVDAETLQASAEIPVGRDPRTVAVDDAGRWAVTANRAAGTVSIVDVTAGQRVADVAVGALPWGVVVSSDGYTAYVACEESDRVAVVDVERRTLATTIPTEDRPAGLALSDDGATLYVTHLLDGRVSVVDTASARVTGVIDTWQTANLSQSIVLHPDGTHAYLAQTRSNSNTPALAFDNTVFPVITVVDLNAGQLLPRDLISLPEADTPVGLPYDAAFAPDGRTLYVVNAASNDVSVINLGTGQGMAHVQVADNPRGIVVAPDGARAYVNNTLAGTVSAIDTRTYTVTAQVQVTSIPLPPTLLLGKRLFHSSDRPELTHKQWISCNSCHWEGELDGRTWRLGFAGPRNTTSLLGMVATYPLRWSAEWDESADSEFAIVREQFGTGLIGGQPRPGPEFDPERRPPVEEMHPTRGAPNAGRSYELDCLAAYIDSLVLPPNPHRDEFDPAVVQRGAAVFSDPRTECRSCHYPPHYTDFKTHDVGTVSGPEERLGPEIDTPTLRGLYRSAPYLHDGRAAALYDVLTTANPDDRHGATSHLSEEDLWALVTFMLAIP